MNHIAAAIVFSAAIVGAVLLHDSPVAAVLIVFIGAIASTNIASEG